MYCDICSKKSELQLSEHASKQSVTTVVQVGGNLFQGHPRRFPPK